MAARGVPVYYRGGGVARFAHPLFSGANHLAALHYRMAPFLLAPLPALTAPLADYFPGFVSPSAYITLRRWVLAALPQPVSPPRLFERAARAPRPIQRRHILPRLPTAARYCWKEEEPGTGSCRTKQTPLLGDKQTVPRDFSIAFRYAARYGRVCMGSGGCGTNALVDRSIQPRRQPPSLLQQRQWRRVAAYVQILSGALRMDGDVVKDQYSHPHTRSHFAGGYGAVRLRVRKPAYVPYAACLQLLRQRLPSTPPGFLFYYYTLLLPPTTSTKT